MSLFKEFRAWHQARLQGRQQREQIPPEQRRQWIPFLTWEEAQWLVKWLEEQVEKDRKP